MNFHYMSSNHIHFPQNCMEDKTVIVNYCNQTDGSLSPIRQQELLSSQLEPC